MFIGRKQEMRELVRREAQSGFQFPVIYGRRRVGKTRLIREFIKERPSIYFMATEQSDSAQLKAFTQAIKEQYEDKRIELLDSFSDWEVLFSFITDISQDNRLILVIDEYPYLAKAVPEISSILQKYIDHHWKDTQLYFILCGSSMSFMERQVLGYQSPLYGRRTAQIKLHPMPHYEAIKFFPQWSFEEKLYAFGVCGGIPQYLEIFSKYSSFKEAVCGEFLSISGHLSEEPENLMQQELREPAFYNSILQAIAKGASRQNDIAMAVGKNPNQLSTYLDNLIDLEILEKVNPIGGKNTRKVIYRIKDNLYRFWFRFIPDCKVLSALGLEERAYKEKIEPSFSEYFGHVFEKIAMEYIKYQVMVGEIQELYTEYGQWWGNNPQKKQEEEIDIVCANEEHILVGECKWRNSMLDIAVLDKLKERARLLAAGRQVHYILFSKSGFKVELVEKAQREGVILISTKDFNQG